MDCYWQNNVRGDRKIANLHRKVINLVDTKNKSTKFIWEKKKTNYNQINVKYLLRGV